MRVKPLSQNDLQQQQYEEEDEGGGGQNIVEVALNKSFGAKNVTQKQERKIRKEENL